MRDEHRQISTTMSITYLTSFETYPTFNLPLTGGGGGRKTCLGIHVCECAMNEMRSALRCATSRAARGLSGYVN